MPPTLTAPGVYIQELPAGSRSIAGVSTSLTAFVGPASRGPVNEPTKVTSWAEFERMFGGLSPVSTMTQTVRHYFQNGGTEALVVRVVNGEMLVLSATAAAAVRTRLRPPARHRRAGRRHAVRPHRRPRRRRRCGDRRRQPVHGDRHARHDGAEPRRHRRHGDRPRRPGAARHCRRRLSHGRAGSRDHTAPAHTPGTVTDRQRGGRGHRHRRHRSAPGRHGRGAGGGRLRPSRDHRGQPQPGRRHVRPHRRARRRDERRPRRRQRRPVLGHAERARHQCRLRRPDRRGGHRDRARRQPRRTRRAARRRPCRTTARPCPSPPTTRTSPRSPPAAPCSPRRARARGATACRPPCPTTTRRATPSTCASPRSPPMVRSSTRRSSTTSPRQPRRLGSSSECSTNARRWLACNRW